MRRNRDDGLYVIGLIDQPLPYDSHHLLQNLCRDFFDASSLVTEGYRTVAVLVWNDLEGPPTDAMLDMLVSEVSPDHALCVKNAKRERGILCVLSHDIVTVLSYTDPRRRGIFA